MQNFSKLLLTVRTALELEVFRRTEATVYAGADRMDRPVRWVHAGEIPDIHRFLTGGEMLLTAGLGMGTGGEEQRAFVRRIAAAGAAVLVVELAGRAFSEMPPAAVSEAEALGLPLVGLRDEIPFVEASAQVHEMLMDLRMSEVIAEEATGQAFLDLLLAGEDYVAMTAELANRTGHPVVLEDVTHQIVAYAGRTDDSDEVVADWAAHSRAAHERHVTSHDRARPAPRTPPGRFRDVAPCARRAVVLRGESWGALHLLHGAVPPAPADLSALERAATAVAITLLGERESGARSAKRHGALLNRLMLGDISGEEFLARALMLGADLRDRPLVVAVTAPDTATGTFTDQDLRALLRASELPCVVADLEDHGIAVVGVAPGRSDRDLGDLLAGRGVRGGLSRVVAPAQLSAAVRQARTASAAARMGDADRPLRFDEVGVLRLLVALAEGPELARYVEDELGPLLRHDATAAGPLLPTLRAFLDCGGNKSKAAELLYVQRRTLYYRLDRIAALTGMPLDDVETQQRLGLAVRGHDLLRRDARGSAGGARR
ncbi:PucR family transcriptional regulator [Pseudonocardia acaciae]|uniref:PucR family transcriptional regulator n=1 Tax=Pseudonocardia acaciae TaxID=551276 RepID=UPI00048BD81F|nr:PucR family transcriptional regulator ligand-binding domain-containing protein [Pseudonocardia acaciae]